MAFLTNIIPRSVSLSLSLSLSLSPCFSLYLYLSPIVSSLHSPRYRAWDDRLKGPALAFYDLARARIVSAKDSSSRAASSGLAGLRVQLKETGVEDRVKKVYDDLLSRPTRAVVSSGGA